MTQGLRWSSYMMGIALIVAIGWGMLIRVDLWPRQAGHVDDLLVPFLMNSEAYTLPKVKERMHDRANKKYNSAPFKLLRKLETAGALEVSYPLIRYCYKVHDIANNTTYAPGQYLLTSFLVHEGNSYESSIRGARWPSLALGCLVLLLMPYWLIKVFGRTSVERGWWHVLPAALIATVLLACSGEAIVLSAHSAPYAIAPVLVILLFILLSRALNILPSTPAPKQTRLPAGWRNLAIISGLLCWFQYQLVFFLPAVLVAFLAHSHLPKIGWRRLWQAIQMGLWQALFVAPLILAYLGKRSGSTVNWNAGPTGEFVYKLPASENPFAYTLRFFAENVPVTIGAMIGPVVETHPAFSLIAYSATALVAVGLIILITSKQQVQRTMGFALLTVAVIWLAGVLAGKFSLSPTRHNHVLAPLMAFCIGASFYKLTSYLLIVGNRRRWVLGTFSICTATLSLALVAQAHVTWQQELPLRSDHYSEKQLDSLARQYQVDGIMSFGWTYNSLFMPALRDKVHMNYNQGTQRTLLPGFHLDQLPARVLAHSQRTSLEEFSPDSLAKAIQRDCRGCAVRYRVTQLINKPGQREHEFIQLTRNGRSGQYVYLFERK